MISDVECSAEIVQRFKNKDPLNLSAIKVECPSLLEGLFDAKNFKSWREWIELAGVDIGAIRIERLRRSLDRKYYQKCDEVVAELKRRYQKGGSFDWIDLERSLLKWCNRYFGSYANALAAAGVSHPGLKPAAQNSSLRIKSTL
jgi:hypothetical protein